MTIRLTVQDIDWCVTRHFALLPGDLSGPKGSWRVAHPRLFAMYLAREMTQRSFPYIGRWFKRDHTTVIHACHRIPVLMEMDPAFKRQGIECRELIRYQSALKPGWLEHIQTAPLFVPMSEVGRRVMVPARSQPHAEAA